MCFMKHIALEILVRNKQFGLSITSVGGDPTVVPITTATVLFLGRGLSGTERMGALINNAPIILITSLYNCKLPFFLAAGEQSYENSHSSLL